MKVFYSIASVKGPDDSKNPTNFNINGAVRPPEEESIRYSSISILDKQKYEVIEEKEGRSAAARLSLKNRSLSAEASDGMGIYRVRDGEILRLIGKEAKNRSEEAVPECFESDSLPGDLYILCSGGLEKTLSADRIFAVAKETDRIQEIASALQKAAVTAGCGESLTVLAVRREL